MEAEMKRYTGHIHAAFDALLRSQFSVAKVHLAKAQREEYGMRPWQPGMPTRDACGNTIVFEDAAGCYSIPLLRDNGIQIRVLLGARRRVSPPLAFEVHAPVQTTAIVLGYSWGHTERLKNVEIDGAYARADGWAVVRFRHRSDCLD